MRTDQNLETSLEPSFFQESVMIGLAFGDVQHTRLKYGSASYTFYSRYKPCLAFPTHAEDRVYMSIYMALLRGRARRYQPKTAVTGLGSSRRRWACGRPRRAWASRCVAGDASADHAVQLVCVGPAGFAI